MPQQLILRVSIGQKTETIVLATRANLDCARTRFCTTMRQVTIGNGIRNLRLHARSIDAFGELISSVTCARLKLRSSDEFSACGSVSASPAVAAVAALRFEPSAICKNKCQPDPSPLQGGKVAEVRA